MYSNVTYDLDSNTIAAIQAADVAADLLAKGGTPAMTAGELAVIARLVEAMRGRGCTRILNQLLEQYHNASTAKHFVSPAQAAACGAVDTKTQGAY